MKQARSDLQPRFDKYADSYESELSSALAVSGEGSEFYASERIRWLKRRLGRFANLHLNEVLDYGCGIGGSSPILLEVLCPKEVIGVDVSPRSIDVARARFASSQLKFFTVSEYVPDGSVDLVYCNGVFHHIPPARRSAALDWIRSVLRPGALFAMWENNPWNPGTRYIMSRCAFDDDAITITPSSARTTLRRAGFEVIEVTFRFLFPRALSALRPLEPIVSGMPLGGQYQVLSRKPIA